MKVFFWFVADHCFGDTRPSLVEVLGSVSCERFKQAPQIFPIGTIVAFNDGDEASDDIHFLIDQIWYLDHENTVLLALKDAEMEHSNTSELRRLFESSWLTLSDIQYTG